MASINTRYAAVDALRGLIMIIMAIDHSSAFIARQHSNEFWNGAISIYSSVLPFLTRWITHLCAPGFFFLMGAGLAWFAASRRDLGWNEPQIIRRALTRGFAIFLTGQVLETPVLILSTMLAPAPVRLARLPFPTPNDGQAPYWGFVTLTGLGLVLMLCALLLKLRPTLWLAVSAAAVIATHALLPVDGKVGPIWQTLLLAPGLSQHLIVVYPVIPWLGVAAFGMYFGYWWRTTPEASSKVWIWGLALLAIGIALRAAGSWGNIVPARDGSWIEFLNNVKYPPSLVFWTMSVGLDLLLLTLLFRLPTIKPLVVFGQTPLFFYLAHFYLLAAIAFAFFRKAAPLEAIYPVWVFVVMALYPVCLWYRGFKSSKPPESLWRLF